MAPSVSPFGRRAIAPLAVLAVAVTAASFALWPAEAAARSLEQLEKSADNFDSRVQRLERRYLKPALVESAFKIESQYNDGRVAYLNEEYGRASLLLVDVVRDPDFEQFDSHREALYMLGDSLFRERTYRAAKTYFERLVNEGEGEYYQESIKRLLEIASKTEDYDRVGELYRQFNSDSGVRPAVEYVRGKTLFDQQEYEEAIPFFERAGEDADYKWRATYFLGVSRAALGRLESARSTFEQLQDRAETEGADQKRISEMTSLALGRVAYEQGRLEEAIDYYDELPRRSPHYDRALYETTWVLVAAGEYDSALRNAEIFLLLEEPDRELLSEMRLLRADLLLRREKFDRATASYRQVKETFEPVVVQMEERLAEQESVQAYFSELVSEEMEGREPTYLPGEARRWVDETEQMDDLETMVEDVASLESDIEQSKQGLREVEARLRSGSRIKSFPRMAEGMAVGIETESSLIQLRRQLLEKEFQILRTEMTPSERDRWRELREELEAFEERYEAIPKTRRAIQNRDRKLDRRFDDLADKLDRINRAIDFQRRQLRGVEKYLDEHSMDQYSEEDRAKIDRLREEVEAKIDRMEERRDAIRGAISVARQKVGVGDEVTKREQKMRETYRQMLRERREFLASLHGRVGESREAKLRRVRRARRPLPSLSARLQKFFKEMRRLVDQRARTLIQTARAERKRLDEREQRLGDLKGSSTRTMAELARRNYRAVQRHFDQLVVRGDVGLIDVAWRKKEQRTEEINEARAEHKAELKSIQEKFDKLR